MRKRRTAEEAQRLMSEIEREVAKGLTVELACRAAGVSVNCYYNWKQRFANPAGSEAARIRGLEAEVRRLKTLVADLALDKQMLQDVVQKKW
jgi:putative transposase